MKALFLPILLFLALTACGPSPGEERTEGRQTPAEAVTGGEHDTVTLDTSPAIDRPAVTPVPMDSSMPEDRD